jgi:hypothetical protein
LAVGTTYDHNLTRDELLQLAYEDLGIITIGDTLTGEQVDRGVKKLNNIIRQVDYEGRHLWADVTSAHLELVAT